LGTLSNVVEDTTPQLGGFLDANGNYMQTEKGGDIASASPLVIDTDGDYFDVTGTTGFAAMTVVADRQFTLQFDGALTMTHHATNLDLPGESNITTAAGDVAIFQSTGSNTVQCISYTRADGTAVVGSVEGTVVLSTGEAGGTKYLREDGDGTSSWQTAPVTSVSGSTGAVADGDIDHDSLANFAANEHYTQANITATGTVASGVWQGTAIDGTYVDLEGTELKSTGEAGGTKFLREDSDGTCSWQTPPVTSVSGSTGAVADGDIDHDSLANFAANEHFTQANITATGTIATGVWNGTAIGSAYLTSASTTVSGASELATAAEINTGTDAGRTITPDALAGSNLGTVRVVLTAIAPATDCAVADDNAHFHVPSSMAGMNLVSVHAENITAGTTGTGTYQVRNDTSGNNMLSTAITIDSGETGSDTAATPAVIDAAEDDLAENDLISIDIDGIQTTAAKGLIVTLEFRLP
jgi:hypothetical protein